MRALIVAAEGSTDEEYVYPFYRLQEAGFDVNVMTLDGAVCRGVSGLKIKPIPEYAGVHWLAINGRDPYPDLLVLVGGVKAIEKLRLETWLINYIAKHHARGGVIASICHGAQLLISAKLCAGRKVSGYYSIREDIENAGGTYVDEPAVVCDRIVSTAHYKHMGAWMAAALREASA